jgi:UDP-N-acetylmuramate: L-alanyl-gamma-D-glutamyl-meso-diaminopimelate ligase
VLLFQPPDLGWDLAQVGAALGNKARTLDSVNAMVAALANDLKKDDHVLIMSNGGFDGIHAKLLERLQARSK